MTKSVFLRHLIGHACENLPVQFHFVHNCLFMAKSELIQAGYNYYLLFSQQRALTL